MDFDSHKRLWLVYQIRPCEMGTDGYSGWCSYCIAQGETDKEIYNSWAENMRTLYGGSYKFDPKEHNGSWSDYYPLAKIELPKEIYGHAQQLELIKHFIPHPY